MYSILRQVNCCTNLITLDEDEREDKYEDLFIKTSIKLTN